MPPHTDATTRHQLRPSRGVAAALVTLGLLVGLVAPATSAGAQTSGSGGASAASATELRAQADQLSSQYFATLASFAQADAAVRDNEAEVADLKTKAAAAKAAARERALLAYKSSGGGLSAIISGDTTADAARRVKLVDTVNARDRSAYKSFRSTAKALKAKRQALNDARKAQEQSLADLKAQGAALDAKLAEAQQREQAAAATAAAVAAQAQASQQAQAAATTAPPTTTTTPPAPTPPSGYTGTPGVSPHHDDPFLTCVRARESGGNYGAVNPAGPYLGAYQFLQSTWNGAASHAGRGDLIGVPVTSASPFDQDEVAWALYQWQGAAPWGGHCP